MSKKWEKFINFFLCLVIFLLPWQMRLIFKRGELNSGFWEYGSYSFYFFDFVVILFIVFALDYLEKFKLKNFNLKRKIELLFVLFFLSLTFLSLFWSINFHLSLYYFVRLFLAVSLFFIVSLTKINWLKIAFAFIFAGIIQSFLALWQFFSQNFFASKILGIAFQTAGRLGASVIEFPHSRWLRAYGSFPHPNILAGFLLTVIFFDIYLIVKEKRKICLYFLPLFIFAFLVTFSRSAIFSFLFILLFWLFLGFVFKDFRDFREIVFISLLIIFIFVFLLAPFFLVRFTSQERIEMISLKERLNQFSLSKDLIKGHFLLGTGLGTSTFALYLAHSNFPAWFYQPVHNIYFIIFQELGIIGLVIFLFLLLFSFLTFFKENLNKKKVILFSLFFSFLIISFFDHYFWTINCTLILWWLIFALFVSSLDKEKIDK